MTADYPLIPSHPDLHLQLHPDARLRPRSRPSRCRRDRPTRFPVGALARLRFGLAVSAMVLTLAWSGAAADLDRYRTDTVPFLRDYCVGCHNDRDRDGEFSVETFQSLLAGGENGPVIVPGDARLSPLIQVLTGGADPSMPPKGEPRPPESRIAALASWIDSGAAGPVGADDRSFLADLIVPDVKPRPHVPRPVTAAAYSRDGNRLALGYYGRIDLLNADDQAVFRVLKGMPGKVNAVEFSRDGSRVIAATGVAGLRGEAILLDANSGEPLRSFTGEHNDALFDAALSPDGRVLATAGYDRRILIWDTDTGAVSREIDGHNGAVFDLAFSPDGTVLASASADETVKLWTVSSGRRLDTLNQPRAEQYTVAFTPDGEFVAAAGADNRIRLWRLVSRTDPAINPLVHARFAHESDIVGLSISSDGDWLISSSADRSIKIWSLPDLRQVRAIGGQSDVAFGLAFHPDNRTFTAARMDGTIGSWSVPDRDEHAIASVRPDNPAPDRSPVREPELESGSASPSASATGDSPETHARLSESEPNDEPGNAMAVTLPAEVTGRIQSAGDVDLFRFDARAGEDWVIETNAARDGSKLDSKIEILDSDGNPIEQVILQALRDSWFTFRGKDSDTPDDFRLQNWREMELNEYLFANGEVVKLWLYPRGPDSGFKVYPGFGKRRTYFGTTALSHPLGEPCYIVKPLAPTAEPAPNGLPVFRLYYENDDEPFRRWGRDSQVLFTAPADGSYLARVTDVRGFGGTEFHYTLVIRPRRPDFTVRIGGANPSVSPGSGREFSLSVDRFDGFEGEIRVAVSGLPPGFSASTPIVIEQGQDMAFGVIHADSNAAAPPTDAAGSSTLTATAVLGGQTVSRVVGTLGTIQLGEPAKLLVEILPDDGRPSPDKGPLEFTIAPGETITARVRATRIDFKDRIALGNEDSGRNLPHGVFVDNIGLNGLLIVEGQSERQFFITAAPWVQESTRFFHLRAAGDGGQASQPALLHVRRGAGHAAR